MLPTEMLLPFKELGGFVVAVTDTGIFTIPDLAKELGLHRFCIYRRRKLLAWDDPRMLSPKRITISENPKKKSEGNEAYQALGRRERIENFKNVKTNRPGLLEIKYADMFDR